MKLAGKTAIVTGASRGIGEAIARHFAAAGANVVLTARSEATLDALVADIGTRGGRAIAVAGDVARYSDVLATVDRAERDFGGVDILINNAGLIEPVARLAESDPNAWHTAVDVNYKGVYHGLRAVIPALLKRGGGSVVNISSGAATSALEGWSHYCSSKAAALMLTRCAHLEYHAQNIRVVGLSPGTVRTEMQDAIRASGVNPVSRLDPSVHIPPEWVARAAAWLCSAEADDYLGADFSLKTDEGRRRVGLPTTG